MRSAIRLLATAGAAGLLLLGGCGNDAPSATGPLDPDSPATYSLRSDLRTVANEMEAHYTEHRVYPVVTHTGAGTSLAGGVTLHLSSGSTITGGPSAGGTAFCLTGTSPGVHTQYYDTGGGGLTTTPCS